MDYKSQVLQNISVRIHSIKYDGTDNIGDATNLTTTILDPSGSTWTPGVSGTNVYTEATFSEIGTTGQYDCIFPATAPLKVFTSVDQSNPYRVILATNTADVGSSGKDIRIISQYPWELALETSVGLLQSSVDNIGSGISRIQTSLVDQVLVPSGNNWVKVVVLVNDSVGTLFDPADITDPFGPQLYNNIGAKFTDIDDDQVVMYKDDTGTPLDQVTLCAHAPQDNKPQLLERDGHGLYYYWMNATATGDVLPIGQLKTIFGMFDIPQESATYSASGSFLIQDTDPSSHLHILFAVTISAATGTNERLDSIVEDISEHEAARSAMQTRLEGTGYDPAQNSLKNIKDRIG